MKRLLVLIAIVTILATGISFVAARWFAERPLATLPPLQDALHLTADQARQVATLEKEYRAKLDDCCKRHCDARFDLGQELGKPEVNQTNATVAVSRMCAVQSEIENTTLAHILRVREILTPAQRTQYAQLLNQQVCTACPMGMH
jgi:hypothetical protein